MVLNDGVRGFSLRQAVRIIETTNLDSHTGPPHIRRRAKLKQGLGDVIEGEELEYISHHPTSIRESAKRA